MHTRNISTFVIILYATLLRMVLSSYFTVLLIPWQPTSSLNRSPLHASFPLPNPLVSMSLQFEGGVLEESNMPMAYRRTCSTDYIGSRPDVCCSRLVALLLFSLDLAIVPVVYK